MRIGFTYDLRDDYLREGYSEEEAAEFDAAETIDAIAAALVSLGHVVDRIGGIRSLAARLTAGERWDLVFNYAEGLFGYAREAQAPALLDAFQIPYTFSDGLAFALTLHKGFTKHVVRDLGIPTPDFAVVSQASDLDRIRLPYPLFVKPVASGSSVGISAASYVEEASALRSTCRALLEKFQQPALVETFLPGRELTVGIVGTGPRARVLGVMEVLFTEDAEAHGYSVRRHIGRAVRLNGVPYTIVGVMPPRFFGTEVGRAFDFIVPLHTEPLSRGRDSALDNPGSNFLTVIARLGAGQKPDSVMAALRSAQPEIREATISPFRQGMPRELLDGYLREPFALVTAETGFSNLRRQYERPLIVISAVVALVLLVACLNIANLLLARAIARRQELKVRMALGASRWRLARQLFTESLVLATAGAALGVAIAPSIGSFLVRQLSTPANVVFLDTSIDRRVLAFTVAVTVVTALLFGTAPAFRAARVSLMDTLKERGQAVSEQLHGGMAGWLVVVQVALSVVLVVAAGLFLRSFAWLASRELGFEPDRVLVVTVDPERTTIDLSQRRALYERVRSAVLALPDVGDAAISFLTPVATGGLTPPVEVEGAAPAIIRDEVFGNPISPGWFTTFGMRLVAGRDITERDRSGVPRVAIVNETFARRYVGSGSPLGRTITIWPNTPRALRMEVVGVAADAVYFSARAPVPPSWYSPIAQFDAEGFPFSPVRLSVRPRSGPPALLTRQVEAAIASVDPQLALMFRPLDEQVHASLIRERLMAQLGGFFGALALLLAGLGLYGVTAYAISRRRTEIGIRMALGAAPAGVIRLVLGRVSMLVATGVVTGMVLSIWAVEIRRWTRLRSAAARPGHAGRSCARAVRDRRDSRRGCPRVERYASTRPPCFARAERWGARVRGCEPHLHLRTSAPRTVAPLSEELMSNRRTTLLQGTLDLLILKALSTGELHGLGVSRRIEQMTGGTFVVQPGSLFPALHRLEEAGWLASTWDASDNNRRAKYYSLTRTGRRQLAEEKANWNRIALAIARALEA